MGVPPVAPTLADVLAAWRWSPGWDALILLVTATFVVLAVRAGGWPWQRVLAWCAAMAVLVVSLDGPVAVYGDVLFWVHMVQHLALIMVVPVLLVWAQPIRLVLRARPRTGGGVRDSRAMRLLTSPLPALACYAAVVVLTHLTGFQEVALADPAVRAVEEALYLATGYLLFLPLIGSDAGPYSGPRALPYLFRFAVLVLAMGVDTLTGVVLMLTAHPLAPSYAATGWGPTALADQNIAGAIMWWGGDGLMMLLLVIVGLQWGRAPAAEQGLGTWIEGVRRQTVLAGGTMDGITTDGITTDGATAPVQATVDDDDDALRAYNDRLAALHRGEAWSADGGGGGRGRAG